MLPSNLILGPYKYICCFLAVLLSSERGETDTDSSVHPQRSIWFMAGYDSGNFISALCIFLLIIVDLFYAVLLYTSLIQVRNILIPGIADRHSKWRSCKHDIDQCSAEQLQILQGWFYYLRIFLGKVTYYMSDHAYCSTSATIMFRFQGWFSEGSGGTRELRFQRIVPKLVLCALPVRDTGAVVCIWLPHAWKHSNAPLNPKALFSWNPI
jgi:hypothetical protein